MTNVRWLPPEDRLLPEELNCMIKEKFEDGEHWVRFVMGGDKIKNGVLILISFN